MLERGVEAMPVILGLWSRRIGESVKRWRQFGGRGGGIGGGGGHREPCAAARRRVCRTVGAAGGYLGASICEFSSSSSSSEYILGCHSFTQRNNKITSRDHYVRSLTTDKGFRDANSPIAHQYAHSFLLWILEIIGRWGRIQSVPSSITRSRWPTFEMELDV